MNRTDRLLAVLLQLQANGWMRAEDLAAHFEVSKRTIYRDMLALMESGVPIVSAAGQGYTLVEGYFLPPLTFTTDEAVLLLLGADLMRQQFDESYAEAASTARLKITTVLPERLRENVREIQASLRFISPLRGVSDASMQKVRRAIVQRRTLRFGYHSRSGEPEKSEITVRDADPYALVNYDNHWMLAAYCHLRNDIRNFRLDRMDDIEVRPHTFERPANFRIAESDSNDRKIIVRLCFPLAMARWVREDKNYYVVSEQETPDGLIVTLKIRRESDIWRWLLGWGASVTILEPTSLRERIAAEAEKTLVNAKRDISLLT